MGVCEEHMLVLEQLLSLEGSGELQRMLNAMQAQELEPVMWQRVVRVPVNCRQAGSASTTMHEPPTAPHATARACAWFKKYRHLLISKASIT